MRLTLRTLARKLCVLVGVFALLSTLFLLHGVQTAFAIAPKPPTDWSFYMFTPNSSQAYTLGYNQGKFDAGFNPVVDSEVVLDFGGPSGPGDGTLNYSAIESASEQFALGYYVGTGADSTSVVTLGLGTNNSADVTYNDGVTWAHTVKAVANWVSANAGQAVIVGANDIEPGWSSFSAAKSWVQGFIAGGGSFYLNFGSADGCPQYSTGNGGCANGWNQDDVYYVSWGAAPAFATPEIYYDFMPRQWSMISLYGKQKYSSPIYFQGPWDEYDRDMSTLTQQQAWNDLWTDLNNNSLPTYMPYSLEIHLASF